MSRQYDYAPDYAPHSAASSFMTRAEFLHALASGISLATFAVGVFMICIAA